MLGERLESACQENTELRANLASLQARLARHDQLEQQRTQQVLALQIRDPVLLKHARPPWRMGARVNEQASVARGRFFCVLSSSWIPVMVFKLQSPGIWPCGMVSTAQTSPFHLAASQTRQQIPLRLRLPSLRSSHFVRCFCSWRRRGRKRKSQRVARSSCRIRSRTSRKSCRCRWPGTMETSPCCPSWRAAWRQPAWDSVRRRSVCHCYGSAGLGVYLFVPSISVNANPAWCK